MKYDADHIMTKLFTCALSSICHTNIKEPEDPYALGGHPKDTLAPANHYTCVAT